MVPITSFDLRSYDRYGTFLGAGSKTLQFTRKTLYASWYAAPGFLGCLTVMGNRVQGCGIQRRKSARFKLGESVFDRSGLKNRDRGFVGAGVRWKRWQTVGKEVGVVRMCCRFVFASR
jgi:hypothetical protein